MFLGNVKFILIYYCVFQNFPSREFCNSSYHKYFFDIISQQGEYSKHITLIVLPLSSFDHIGEVAVILWTSKAIRPLKSLPSPAEQTRSVQTDLDP